MFAYWRFWVVLMMGLLDKTAALEFLGAQQEPVKSKCKYFVEVSQ